MTELKSKNVTEILQELRDGVRDVFNSDSFIKYLDMVSKFPTYSSRNIMLISSQCPGATLVAGYKTWQTNFDRHVNKGEKAIRIIAPIQKKMKTKQWKRDENGNIMTDADGNMLMEEKVTSYTSFCFVNVFDVSQTSGKPLPQIEAGELHDSVPEYDRFLWALTEISKYPVVYENLPNTIKGQFDCKSILIQKGMSESQTIKTFIHELAHSRLHCSILEKKKIKLGDKSHMETEAESVAYAVCKHFNLDTSEYSFKYIAGWSESHSTSELEASLDIIQKTAARLITEIETRFQQVEMMMVCILQDATSCIDLETAAVDFVVYACKRAD